MGRWRCAALGLFAGAGVIILDVAVAFADNCSSEADCQQTQTYNTTTTVIGTVIAVATAVISILISQAAGASGAAAAAAAAAAGAAGTEAPPSTDVILDGADAINVLIKEGLIRPVTNPDGTTSYVPTSPDFPGDNPNVKGIAWTDNHDGTIGNPVIVVPGTTPPAGTGGELAPPTLEAPTTETPAEPVGPAPPTAPTPPPPVPPMTDPPTAAGMNGALSGSTLGENATKYIKDHNITVVFNTSDGSYWDARNNRIVVNATDNQDAGQILVHEVNHAENNTASNTAWNGGSKTTYVNTMIDQETQGTVESIQSNQQLRDSGKTPPHTFPLENEYNAARDRAMRDYRTAHPGADPADVTKAGTDAGSARVKLGFTNGEVKASTNGQSYTDYYGHSYDTAHPTRPTGGP